MSDPLDAAVRFALPVLFDAVVARFDLDSSAVEQVFGWREPERYKTSRARIVWVPGNGGDVGDVRPARNPGNNPRSLATLGELFTAHISANDSTEPENERRQYEAVRALFDAWYRAVYLAAHGTFEVVSLTWNTTKNERRHGAELVAVCWIEALIPDRPYVLVPVDAEANITTSLDDVDEITATTTTP